MKLSIGGKVYEAEPVDVTETYRPWADFHLSDGSLLRIHVFIQSVFRIKNEYDNEGNPIYHVVTKTFPAVESPENLKKSVDNFDQK